MAGPPAILPSSHLALLRLALGHCCRSEPSRWLPADYLGPRRSRPFPGSEARPIMIHCKDGVIPYLWSAR
ncbi:hypothetical protein TRIUR3_30563 [Triticum urartu]|uniref:Uncharacterized protein n=1 Tax=Triticum urartu TaxID=4572 RepID=M7ZRJ2_TRIUA|nr:hypothetical protein TRIUR3_30563 [Triticum urartu]